MTFLTKQASEIETMASNLVSIGGINGNVKVRFHGNHKPFSTETKNTIYNVVRKGKGGMSVVRSTKTGKVYSLPLTRRVFANVTY